MPHTSAPIFYAATRYTKLGKSLPLKLRWSCYPGLIGTLHLIESKKKRTAIKGEINEFCPLMAVFVRLA